MNTTNLITMNTVQHNDNAPCSYVLWHKKSSYMIVTAQQTGKYIVSLYPNDLHLSNDNVVSFPFGRIQSNIHLFPKCYILHGSFRQLGIHDDEYNHSSILFLESHQHCYAKYPKQFLLIKDLYHILSLCL